MEHITLAGTDTTPVEIPRPAAATRGHAVHEMLLPFSVAYFGAALVTDLAYWRTAEIMWERFSVWLIAGGLVVAALVVPAIAIDLAVGRQRPAWARIGGYVLAALLSLINVFVHSRDGYTAVVPTGLALSAGVVVLLLLSCSAGWALTYRRHLGASQ